MHKLEKCEKKIHENRKQTYNFFLNIWNSLHAYCVRSLKNFIIKVATIFLNINMFYVFNDIYFLIKNIIIR